jgi:hypothetical protein
MILSDEKMKEKFVIQMTGEGMEISGGGRSLRFTACEALMVLDILKAEEENLRRIADEASPLPLRIQFASAPSSPPDDKE